MNESETSCSLKILLITEEDEFYIPLAVNYLLQNHKDEIIEVVAARNPLLKSKIRAAWKFMKTFGLWPTLVLTVRALRAKFLDRFPRLNNTGRFFSVRSVCEAHNKPYCYEYDINSQRFLDHCDKIGVNLIIAVSPTQIFKEKLITLPSHGCINIHTASLPRYRGLYPTYWAMASGEDKLGISIHYIDKGIDTGKIILQDEIDIPARSTLDAMLTKSKVKGAELLSKAIENIKKGNVRSYYLEGQGSYFSFPTRESYKNFRTRGFRLF
ncbi:MAG: hypothetical protein A2169_13295 [Deltaproteobacteria bacterium RBG_13_47_9]|nr:MAG: hypothetical protein A2169_13295 [Deltaproteobacteria bacterium RBG_13_47_9]